MSTTRHSTDAGAGLKLTSPTIRPDEVPVTKGEVSVASRALALSSYFLSGVLSINLSQFLGTPLRLIDEDWYNAWIAFTKQSFGLLTMGLTQAFAPTTVIVSGDASVRGQISQAEDGTLVLDFPERLILIANHQIYTDWLYLWWIAYCNGMHGRLYIILKESLKRIPILGWGMQLSQFIFLKRHWEQDKPQLAQALQRLNKAVEPMWLLLFPEGTNLAPDTRVKSANWAKKNNIADTKHVLLPRSTGLQFCLEELKGTTDYLYDCTVAYEGVPRGQFAQDIFTLKAGYLEGRPPKSVSMYWRRFAIKDIPTQNQKAFELWLTARWREKDLLMENYLRFGRFPSDIGVTKTAGGKSLRGCGRVQVQIKSSHWYEFLQIFAPMGILAMVLYVFYGALPQKMWKSITREALQTSTQDVKKLKGQAKGVSGSFSLDSFFDRTKQGETFSSIGMDMMKQLQSKEARSIINRAGLVQCWLEDPQKFVTDNLAGELPESKQNFLQALQQEEKRRQQSKTPHQGSFWQDIQEAEKTRAANDDGNNMTAKTPLTKSSLEASQRQHKQVTKHKHVDGSFWSTLQDEENTRRGSVITSSSDWTTAVNSTIPDSESLSRAKTAKPKKLPPKISVKPNSTPKTTIKNAVSAPAPKLAASAIAKTSTTKPNPKSNPKKLTTTLNTISNPKPSAAKTPSSLRIPPKPTKS